MVPRPFDSCRANLQLWRSLEQIFEFSGFLLKTFLRIFFKIRSFFIQSLKTSVKLDFLQKFLLPRHWEGCCESTQQLMSLLVEICFGAKARGSNVSIPKVCVVLTHPPLLKQEQFPINCIASTWTSQRTVFGLQRFFITKRRSALRADITCLGDNARSSISARQPSCRPSPPSHQAALGSFFRFGFGWKHTPFWPRAA